MGRQGGRQQPEQQQKQPKCLKCGGPTTLVNVAWFWGICDKCIESVKPNGKGKR